MIIRRTAHLLETSSRWIDRVMYLIVMPLGVFFVGIVFANVLARYVFSAPIIGSVEYARIAFVWATFFGASMALRRRSHIRLEFAAERLPPKVRRILEVLLRVMLIAFLAFVAYQGWRLTGRVQRTFFPASGVSQILLYLPLPISAAVMLVHTLAHLFQDILALMTGDKDTDTAVVRPEPPGRSTP
jgi:TRAP-type transport system small permease protein